MPRPDVLTLDDFSVNPAQMTGEDWETAWAPYDEDTYRAALEMLLPDDVVLDIGAGDLRFARRAAERARAVIAIEQRAELLAGPCPPKLAVICGDALKVLFPSGLTVAVLLMRHCRHFSDYVAKLRAAGCGRLITNARWRMGLEQIDLDAPRIPFDQLQGGWYACLCGGTGFAVAAAQALDIQALDRIAEVEGCPICREYA